ncbi:MAG: COG1470 family protein, partial [Candidatus Poseidoniales archaeon]
MQRRVSALILVLLMGISPLVPLASADSTIGLSSDISHVILSPGQATNITLSIYNNGSSIESYDVTVAGSPTGWEVIPTEPVISNAVPTLTKSTSIAIRLSTNVSPDDSGSVTITVTEPDANVSTDLVILLTVLPTYLPAIDASKTGNSGLQEMIPGSELNLSIEVRNDGNVQDTLLLSVDQSPDLAGFWANWSNSSNNQSGNNSG